MDQNDQDKGRRSWNLDGAVDQESGDITIGGQVFRPVVVTRGIQRQIHAHQRVINRLNQRRARVIKEIQAMAPDGDDVLAEDREDELDTLEKRRDDLFFEIETEMAKTLQVLLGGKPPTGPSLEHLERSTDVRFTDVLFGHLMGAIDANVLTMGTDPEEPGGEIIEGTARDTQDGETDPRLAVVETGDESGGPDEPDPTPTTTAPDATGSASTTAPPAPSAAASGSSSTASASTGG